MSTLTSLSLPTQGNASFSDSPFSNVSFTNASLANASSAEPPPIGFTGTNDPFLVGYSQAFLVSCLLNIMAYGAVVILFVNMMHLLLGRLWRSGHGRLPFETLVLVTTLFMLNTVCSVSTIVYVEDTYVYNVAFPEGIPAFTILFLATPLAILNQVCFLLGSLLADAFLLARARVIFQAAGSRYPLLCLSPGIILFLASMGLAVIFVIATILPNGVFDGAINWASIYFAVSLAQNLYLTLAIALRICIYRRSARRQSGRTHVVANLYSRLFTMFIESAALYSLVAVGAVATYDAPQNMVWQSISLPVQTIASFLITYRIARGGSWEVEATSELEQRDEEAVLNISRPSLVQESGGVFVLNNATSIYSVEKF